MVMVIIWIYFNNVGCILHIGVILSFERCEYNVNEGNSSVSLNLTASQATNFSYTVEISMDDVDTTPGNFAAYMFRCSRCTLCISTYLIIAHGPHRTSHVRLV